MTKDVADVTKEIFADMASQMTPSADVLAALDGRINATWQPPLSLDGDQTGRTSWLQRKRGKLVMALVAAVCVLLTAAPLLSGGSSLSKLLPLLPTQFITGVADDYAELYKTMAAFLTLSKDYVAREDGMESANTTFTGRVGGSVATTDSGTEAPSYTGTNVQVAGIDEPDIVKTNGEEIYLLAGSDDETYVVGEIGNATEVVVLAPDGANTRELTRFSWPGAGFEESVSGNTTVTKSVRADGLLLSGDTLAVITTPCESTTTLDITNGYVYEWARGNACTTEVLLYDVSTPEAPQLTATLGQSGEFRNARAQNGMLYLISNYYVLEEVYAATGATGIAFDAPETFTPLLSDNGETKLVAPSDIVICPEPTTASYVVVSSIDMAAGKRIDQKSVLGADGVVYMSPNNLYLAGVTYPNHVLEFQVIAPQPVSDETPEVTTEVITSAVAPTVPPEPAPPTESAAPDAPQSTWASSAGDDSQSEPIAEPVPIVTTAPPSTPYEVTFPVDTPSTNLLRIALSDGTLDVAANATIPGILRNQFALDEYENNLRVAVTTRETNWEENAALYVLNPELEVIGAIDTLVVGESVQSVRFMGEVGYVVTFRQTDPLFTIDLSEPTRPAVMGALHMPGFSSYLHPWGTDRLLGIGYQGDQNGLTGGMKLSVFDVSNPYDVREIQTLALDYEYSEAQHDHHAVLADEAAGLIAFPALRADAKPEKPDADYHVNSEYVVYRATDSFELAATVELTDMYQARGLLIDKAIYVYDGFSLSVLDTEVFNTLAQLQLR